MASGAAAGFFAGLIALSRIAHVKSCAVVVISKGLGVLLYRAGKQRAPR